MIPRALAWLADNLRGLTPMANFVSCLYALCFNAPLCAWHNADKKASQFLARSRIPKLLKPVVLEVLFFPRQLWSPTAAGVDDAGRDGKHREKETSRSKPTNDREIDLLLLLTRSSERWKQRRQRSRRAERLARFCGQNRFVWDPPQCNLSSYPRQSLKRPNLIRSLLPLYFLQRLGIIV